MMKRWGLLGSLALLLLVGALVLWRLIGGTTEVTPKPSSRLVATHAADGSASAAVSAEHVAPRIAEGTSGEKAASEDTGEVHELTIEPIKRPPIQREDGAPGSKDALFRKDTLDALRAAVTPAVQKCIKEGLARYPDNAHMQSPVSVAIVYTASASSGTVAVSKAEAIINGTQDDELLPCVEAAYSVVRINAPAGQADGEGRVQAVFDLK
jgi:hypothetical protein